MPSSQCIHRCVSGLTQSGLMGTVCPNLFSCSGQLLHQMLGIRSRAASWDRLCPAHLGGASAWQPEGLCSKAQHLHPVMLSIWPGHAPLPACTMLPYLEVQVYDHMQTPNLMLCSEMQPRPTQPIPRVSITGQLHPSYYPCSPHLWYP